MSQRHHKTIQQNQNHSKPGIIVYHYVYIYTHIIYDIWIYTYIHIYIYIYIYIYSYIMYIYVYIYIHVSYIYIHILNYVIYIIYYISYIIIPVHQWPFAKLLWWSSSSHGPAAATPERAVDFSQNDALAKSWGVRKGSLGKGLLANWSMKLLQILSIPGGFLGEFVLLGQHLRRAAARSHGYGKICFIYRDQTMVEKSLCPNLSPSYCTWGKLLRDHLAKPGLDSKM